MNGVARILLGLALGALLASLPFLHFRYGARHAHGPDAARKESDHASHSH
jgi:hypothetical protein